MDDDVPIVPHVQRWTCTYTHKYSLAHQMKRWIIRKWPVCRKPKTRTRARIIALTPRVGKRETFALRAVAWMSRHWPIGYDVYVLLWELAPASVAVARDQRRNPTDRSWSIVVILRAGRRATAPPAAGPAARSWLSRDRHGQFARGWSTP